MVLASFRDVKHPATLCTMSGSSNVRFISRTDIGYVTTSSPGDPIRGNTLIGRMSLTDLKPVTVATVRGDVLDVAWSPDGSSVAYLLYTEAAGLGSGAANQLWLKVGGASPRALSPLIPLFGRDGSKEDQVVVRFSPDGRYLLMVDTFVAGVAPASPDQASFQVRSVPDGALVWVPPSALGATGKLGLFVTMAVWSQKADRLYYRDDTSVKTWDPPGTVAKLIVAGFEVANWYTPAVSQDGRFIALIGYGMGGPPGLQVEDLVSNTNRGYGVTVGAPFFVSNTVVLVPNLFQGGPPYVQTGVYLEIDQLTLQEFPLTDIVDPIDSWPH